MLNTLCRHASATVPVHVVHYVVAVSSFYRYAFDTVRDGSNEVATAFEWLLDECTRRQFEAPLSLESMVLHRPFTGYPTGPRGAAHPNVTHHKRTRA
jgi:hypothetical protein